MLTIFTVRQWVSHCLSVISSGWQKVNWRIGRQMEMGVSLRLIWNIQKNFIISTTITPLLRNDWWWIKWKSWFLIYGIRTSMFFIISIWSNMKNWVWKSKRHTEESFSQKMHGWNLTSSWALNFEQKPPTILRKISSSWWTTQYLEKLWKISEIVLMFVSGRVKSLLKSLFQNQIMNELQSSVKILLQCIWKKRNLFSTSQFILGCQSSISQKLWCMIFTITTSRKSMDQKQNCS